ncbi:MAG: endonuclease MutS2 [Candidatus Methylomirabilales bacterium]
MDDRTLSGLEFAGILNLLGREAMTSLGRERAASLGPCEGVEQVRDALAEAGEARLLFGRGEEPPFGGVTDVRPHLHRAGIEGAFLDPHSLRQIYETLVAARQLRTFFYRQRDATPLLWKRGSALHPPEALCTVIGEAITPEGEVADAASPGLQEVRKELRALRAAIVEKLDRYLTSPTYKVTLAEPIITLRNDRYVIPVRSSAKRQVRGIVQDQSASGLTLFVEPTPVVEMNNRLRRLLRQEEEEVVRVLRSITAQVGREAEAIGTIVKILGDLDLIIAKGRLAIRLQAGIPRITPDRRMILRQARHPFLVLHPSPQGASREEGGGAAQNDQRPAPVPIDLEVGGAFTVLVITGPNTGGKTVALKTAGLLTLMTLSGLPIPASPDSQIPYYKAVFADIGDEQSIEQSLSTFSSHMGQVIKILAHVGPDALILLDELGAGTDPSEGAALGSAILEALREQGASVIATSHLEAVKAFAAVTPEMENASVEFDPVGLAPRYQIRLGLPGKSYGLEISGRLGLPRPVLDKARGFLSEGYQHTHAFLEALDADRRRVDSLRARLEQEVQTVSHLRSQAEELVVRLRDGVKSLKHHAREEGRRFLLDLRQQGEDLIRALRHQGSRPEETRHFHKRLEELRSRVEAIGVPPSEVHGLDGGIGPGQWVRVGELNREGQVLTPVSPQGTVEVQLNMGRVRVPVTALSPASPTRGSRREIPLFVERSESMSQEISLIGCTVEESTERLEKYLDAAFLGGLRQVRVIHGKGTGSLRKGIHRFLTDHPLVEAFRLADLSDGGTGATLVALKDR